jgi:small subunit ribosomal protein S15
MLERTEKANLINGFKINDRDTGSVEVQVALLTADIKKLTEHFKAFPKDFASKTGLIKKVSRRRRFLLYLQKNNEDKYKQIIERLGLKK